LIIDQAFDQMFHELPGEVSDQLVDGSDVGIRGMLGKRRTG
jgi:hypothetical protein